jgi:xanthine/CO dehydrogenase XdhC/CoxF family maturation factor
MNLGAILPDEIALSILAEMVAARHGRLGIQETQVTVPF